MNRQMVIDFGKNYLKGQKMALRDAEDLLAFVLDVERHKVILENEQEVKPEDFDRYMALLRRRSFFEPIQYILGEVDFCGLKLRVNPSTLIPRSETEELVFHVAKKLEGCDLKGKKLWDLCTGSGCIGLALKKMFPSLQVTLSDISKEALELAKENSIINNLNVRILHSDLLEAFAGEKADFIIANPPYVSEAEYETLQVEVRNFEPPIALLGGKSGCEFYERLQKNLKECLNASGKAFFEIGHEMEKKLLQIFSCHDWKSLEIKKDLNSFERFFFLERE